VNYSANSGCQFIWFRDGDDYSGRVLLTVRTAWIFLLLPRRPERRS